MFTFRKSAQVTVYLFQTNQTLKSRIKGKTFVLLRMKRCTMINLFVPQQTPSLIQPQRSPSPACCEDDEGWAESLSSCEWTKDQMWQSSIRKHKQQRKGHVEKTSLFLSLTLSAAMFDVNICSMFQVFFSLNVNEVQNVQTNVPVARLGLYGRQFLPGKS